MKHRSIKKAMAAITAALVGSSITGASGQNHTETSILIYSEKNRIRATEGNFSLTKAIRNQFTLNLRLTYDGLTGATPTGRTPSKYPQTITRASGGKTIEVAAGEFPTDDAFKDYRFAGEVGLSRPLGRAINAAFGGHASSEYDYKSVGINAGISHDFNRKNTTIGISSSFSHDVVKPVSGMPEPLALFDAPGEDDGERERNLTGKIKNVYDAVFSLAQVLDRKTLLRLNYSLDYSSGYLTDPYKLISMVQPPDSADAGEPLYDMTESRPSTRRKNAVFAEIRRHIFGSALNISYRYFWDSWGVRSHSTDLSLRLDFRRRGAIQPRLRWHHQSRARFYRPYLVQGNALPQYASADSRLARFDALTYGLTYSIPTNAQSRVNLTAEYYSQRGDRSPPEAFGTARSFDLFPKLRAIMLRLGYAHDF